MKLYSAVMRAWEWHGSDACVYCMSRRQLPGDGQGALPSASLWIKEKPPVILASLQAPTHHN